MCEQRPVNTTFTYLLKMCCVSPGYELLTLKKKCIGLGTMPRSLFSLLEVSEECCITEV